MKKTTITKENCLDIKSIIALTLADVDIYLLQNEEQNKDLERSFSVEEIRNQLKKTMERMTRVLQESGLDINESLNQKTIPNFDFLKEKK